MTKKPLVSICCLTYNHEKFIKDALEGFLKQETNFDYEIIIHDDASTDGTTQIILDYAAKHRDKIITIVQSENQYSKGIKPSPTYVWPKARGKYIAMCEGDDYWTDSQKLQNQVDFLDNNDDYVICYHDAIIIDENGNCESKSKLDDKLKVDFTSEDLIKGKMILTLTMCFRNVLSEFPEEMNEVRNGDKFLTSLLGNYGKGKYLSNIKNSVYRKHGASIWSSLNKTNQIYYNGDTRAFLSRYYFRTGNLSIAEYYRKEALTLFRCSLSILKSESNNNSPIGNKIISNYNDLFSEQELTELFESTGINIESESSRTCNVEELESCDSKETRIGDWSMIESNEINVDWILTRKCNYKCNYCTVYNNEKGQFIPLDKLELIVDQLDLLNKDKITLSLSGGEPTIHPNYIDLVSYAIERLGKKVHIQTQTNLSKPFPFYENIVEKFKDQMDQFSFFTSYHFEYAKKEEFIKRIQYLSNNGAFIRFKICAEPDRMDDVKNIYDEAKKIVSNNLQVVLVVVRENYGAYPDKRYKKEDLDWLNFNYTMDSSKPVKVETIQNNQIVKSDKYITDEIIIKNLNKFKGYMCHAGLNSISINGDGSLDPSVCFRKVKESKPNVYENPESILDFNQPIKCPFETCYVPIDLRIPKYNKESLEENLEDTPKNSSELIHKVSSEQQYSILDAEQLIAENKLSEAKTILLDLAIADPSNFEVKNDLSVVSIMEENIEAAFKYICEVLELDIENEIAIENYVYVEQNFDLSSFSDNKYLINIREILGISVENEERIIKAGGKNYLDDKDTLTVNWVITRKCNYTCSYCTVYNNSDKFKSLDELKSAVDQLASLNKKKYKIILTGGEPTIYLKYAELLKYIFEKLGSETKITTISNLGRTNRFFEELTKSVKGFESNLRFVASYHFDFAKEVNFIENVNSLIQNGIEVNVQIMAHPEKMESVKYLEKEFASNKSDNLKYQVMVIRENYGSVPDKRYNNEDLNWLQEFYSEQGEEKNILIETVDGNRDSQLNYYSAPEINTKGLNNYKGMICEAGVSNLSINEHGQVDRAVCFRGGKNNSKNIYKDKDALLGMDEPVICPFDRCGCSADLLIPKYSEDNYYKSNGESGELDKVLYKAKWEEKLSFYNSEFDYSEKLNVVENPSISIVVISWRLHKDTLKNFELLQKQRNQNYELIFVNNGADENEFSSLMPYIDKYIRLKENTGAYLARNIGSLFAESPILFFLEDDGIPEDNLIEAHLEVHNKYEIIAARGVYKNKTSSPLNKIATHYFLGNNPFPIYADLEGNTSYKADVFYKVGGWDDDIRFGGGGVDLSIRLSKEDPDKRKQIYTPGPVIYHDYAKDEEHFSHKREKQKKSRTRLLKIHPNWDEYLKSWDKYWGNSSELILKENGNKVPVSNNTSNPKITICIPTYNRAEFLKEAVDSALNQNYENYEILIVDDGSTDNTAEMVKSINSDKIRYFKSEENLGRPKVRNKLVSLAKGTFLLWLDDDDKLRENILTNYVRVLQDNPEVNIIYGNLLQFDSETGEEIQRFEPNDYSNSKVDMLRNLILGSGLTFPASLIKKELFEQCGLFDEEYLRAQDYELWSRLFDRANFYKINDIVCYYRKHNANVSFSSIVDKSYEAKTIKKVLLGYPLNDLFIKFDLSNQEVLDNVYYHLALSFYNFQDYGTAIFYLNKINNSANEDCAKLMFASLLSIGDSDLINNYIDSLKPIKELKKLNLEFGTIIKNKNVLSSQLEKVVKLSKWDELEDIVLKMNNEFGYIAEVPYYLGVLSENNNDLETALKYYMQAVRFNPKNNKFYEFALKLTDENSKVELNKMKKRVLLKSEDEIDENISNEKELISVIIPTYNRGKYIKTSLKSVLNQTYQNFEILVVNDGGEDVSGIIEDLNDSRIKYISSETNQGPAAARNIGLRNANGKYISYLDDDDSYYPNHLRTLIDQIENSNYKVVYTDAYCVQRVGTENNEIISSKTIPYSIEFSKEILLVMNIAPTQCFMHAKECIAEVGEFDENLGTHEDWDFWIKMSQKYEFKHIKKVTSEFNRRESLGSITTNKLEDFLSTMKIIFERYKTDVKNNVEILKAQQTRIDELMDQVMKSKKEASIIIVTYNSEESIESCLSSLAKTLREYDEVVVVDNNSKDNTIKIIEKSIKNLEQFTFIKSDINLGFSEGCNVGLRNSSNPFVVLLNPDTIVTNNWLDKMISVCKAKDVAAVGPISNYAAGSQNIMSYLNSDELNKIESKELSREIEARFSKKVAETKLLIGFCMVLKRDLLNELGGLDKNLFLGNDDLDLSWQFRLKGYKLLVAIDTFVYHEGQVSFNTEEDSITNKLVVESTDKLYEKLISHYGKGNVPTPIELWGMNWFTPTNGKFNKSSKLLDTKTKGVSIVIPTFNQWEYTKQTIESIEAFTDFRYEIIIVDNASTDNTIEELKKYKSVKVIANEKNLGFPKAINQGILESKGDYVLLLNNDVVVTDGWLTRMVEVANLDEKIGLVGPITNAVSGVQIDKDAKYSSIEDMHKYAKQIREKNKDQILEFPRLAFLCTLIKREVINKIGGLDERFSPGNYEDDDYCLRNKIAGYKAVIAKNVFIHHYGSISFKAKGENVYEERLKTNEKIFINKWGGNLEDLWINGVKVKERKLECPIIKDIFSQSVARAFINIDDEEYDLALENVDVALENYDSSERLGYEKITKEDLLNIAGTIALSKNELEEAKDYFEEELKNNPSSSQACSGLGEVFIKADLLEDSKTMFEWAVINNQENENAVIRLAEVNEKLNLPKDHNTVLQEAEEERV